MFVPTFKLPWRKQPVSPDEGVRARSHTAGTPTERASSGAFASNTAQASAGVTPAAVIAAGIAASVADPHYDLTRFGPAALTGDPADSDDRPGVTTWTVSVSPGDGGDCATIGEAIRAAKAGDRIRLMAGTYHE